MASPKHSDLDATLPDENGGHAEHPQAPRQEPVDQSPIGAESVQRRAPKKPAKAPQMRTVREYKEPLPAADASEDPEAGFEFVDESPLSAMAEASIAECHVLRVGPGKGVGWGPGMAFNFNDGRGPVPLSTGPVGNYQMTKDLYDKITADVGGALFRFIRKGHPPFEQTLPGVPQEFLPMERQQGGGWPNGAATGPNGGFDRRPADEGWGAPERAPLDPSEDPDYDPEVGIAPEEVQQSLLNDWQLNGVTGRWVYYVNGVPSRPPRHKRRPPVHLANPAGFGGDPSMWDHAETKGDPEMKEILKILVSRLDKPATDPMASVANMMRVQLEADKARWEKENQAAERKAQAEKEAAERKASADALEAQARWETDKEQRANEFKIMMARLDKEAEKAEASKNNDVEIAKINAQAEKDKAAAAVASAEKMTQIQADANAQVLQAVTGAVNKADTTPLFIKGMETAATMMGNKGPAGGPEWVDALTRAGETLIPHAADAVAKVRASKPPAENPPTAPSDDDMLVRFLGLIATYAAKGMSPEVVRQHLGTAFMVSGLDADPEKKKKIMLNLRMATPGILAGMLEKHSSGFKNQAVKQTWDSARGFLGTDAGKAWFEAIKAELFPPRPQALPAPPVAPSLPTTPPAAEQ